MPPRASSLAIASRTDSLQETVRSHARHHQQYGDRATLCTPDIYHIPCTLLRRNEIVKELLDCIRYHPPYIRQILGYLVAIIECALIHVATNRKYLTQCARFSRFG